MPRRLRALCKLFATLLVLLSARGAAHPCDFVVAPDGNDSAAGTLQKPFASVARARDAVRALRAGQPARTDPVVVCLRGGIYRITEPITFTAEDSGTAQSPTMYKAYPGETPVISGGMPVDHWIEEEDLWVAVLPAVAHGDEYFRQLWVNGRRRLRPRVPEDGYFLIHGAVPPTGDPDTWEGQHPDRFRYRKGDIRGDWSNRDDVELLIFHPWSMSRLPIAAVDEEEDIVTLRSTTWHPVHATLHRGARYIVENVHEHLRPGEWYLDRQTGELTYSPLAGETPEDTEIIVPRARQLVVFAGQPGTGAPVRHVELRGLTFEHTLATLPDDGYSVPQAEVAGPLRSAIEATWAEHLTLADCTVRHVGAHAVEFGVSCHHNTIRGCEMWDLGGGGVLAGTHTLYPEGDTRHATRLTVEDCLIAHGGRMHPAAVGIWIGHSGHNRILFNTIHDFYYTGISSGWNWGWGYSPAKDNLIAHNHIYDIGQERLDDLGAIYTLGASEGTVLSHNRIHDVRRVAYTGAGIYFDQSTTGITVTNNLVFRTQDASFTVNYASNNSIRNNIFAYGEEVTLRPGRTDTGGPMIFERNLVAWGTGTAYLSENVREDFAANRNLYWSDYGDMDNFADNRSFAWWQSRGRDVNSVVADPGFADPENGDFRLPADSPAQSIGFVPWDLMEAGRRPDMSAIPAVPHTFPPAGGPRNVPLDEDFSRYPPGGKPADLLLFENNDTEVIRVTDEKALSGARSLKITDRPSTPSWNPHGFWAPNFTEGLLVAELDLYLRPGAVLIHEWRDTGPGAAYRTGPSLSITADGRLSAGGGELMTLPHNQWIHFQVTCGVGGRAGGEWTLQVQLHGGPAERFENLPCSPAFRRLRWFGFIAAGTAPAEAYVDHVRLRPVHRLIYAAGPGGWLEGEASQEVPHGDEGTEVKARADEGARFDSWSDAYTVPTRKDNVVGDLSITARFRSAGGVPIDWYARHHLTPSPEQTWADLDSQDHTGKGTILLEDYIADTDPHDIHSRFRVTHIALGPPRAIHFVPSSQERRYRLQYTEDLHSSIWADVPGQASHLGTGAGDLLHDCASLPRPRFYRIHVMLP